MRLSLFLFTAVLVISAFITGYMYGRGVKETKESTKVIKKKFIKNTKEYLERLGIEKSGELLSFEKSLEQAEKSNKDRQRLYKEFLGPEQKTGKKPDKTRTKKLRKQNRKKTSISEPETFLEKIKKTFSGLMKKGMDKIKLKECDDLLSPEEKEGKD